MTSRFRASESAAVAGAPTLRVRARKIGHTILNTTVDRPWSQYFCCLVSGSADYVNRYPVATKRVLRAVLKGALIKRMVAEASQVSTLGG